MEPKIRVESAEPLSPHDKALLEAGGSLLKESVEAGRDFCKSMITVCLTAVPAYVGVLTLFLEEEQAIGSVFGWYWFLPIALFLAAMVLFFLGYMPLRGRISLDLPSDVEAAIERSARWRYRMGLLGLSLLVISVVIAVAILATHSGAR